MQKSDRENRGPIDLNARMEELAPVLSTLPKGTHVAFLQEGDEISLYNITRALELVADRPATVTIDVAERARQIQPRSSATLPEDKVFIDPDHAATVDLSYPIMVIESRTELDGRQLRVIDGWHRIYRAAQLGIVELPAVVISPEEEALIRIELDPDEG